MILKSSENWKLWDFRFAIKITNYFTTSRINMSPLTKYFHTYRKITLTIFKPMKPMIIMSNFLFVIISKTIACGAQVGLGRDFVGFFPPAFFMAAMYFFWSSVMRASRDPPLLFCSLNLSMMTPTRRLRVKKLPKTINATKNRYKWTLFSENGCWFN